MKKIIKLQLKLASIYLITLIIISIIPVSAVPVSNDGNNSGNKYKTLVDQYHGFHSVYNLTSGMAEKTYQNNTLNISIGDVVVWTNDAVPDTKLTIINEQKLWDKSAGVLNLNYKEFRYKFNKSGIYDVYINEYKRFKQKIVVGIDVINSTNRSTVTKNISKSIIKDNTIKNNTEIKTDNLNLKKENDVPKKNNLKKENDVPKKNNIERKDHKDLGYGRIMLFLSLLISIIFIFLKVK